MVAVGYDTAAVSAFRSLRLYQARMGVGPAAASASEQQGGDGTGDTAVQMLDQVRVGNGAGAGAGADAEIVTCGWLVVLADIPSVLSLHLPLQHNQPTQQPTN